MLLSLGFMLLKNKKANFTDDEWTRKPKMACRAVTNEVRVLDAATHHGIGWTCSVSTDSDGY